MQKRAPFVVIEGLDRSGKTTQIALLHSRLESMGIRTQLVKFPDRTTAIGKMIDSYLRSQSELDDHAIHLLFSANRWELASTITNLLTSGTLVLCDRYAFSGITFSAAKPSLRDTFPSTHGDALPWCRAPDISLPAPDLTIFLDITPEQAKIRDGYGEERYEKEETQKRVREMFHRLGAEMTSSQDDVNSNRDNRWIVVDAGREREKIAQELWQLVEPLTKGLDGDIARLWEDKLSF
ncbi:Thymidylate kinase [Leucoagaricus gongylophorus]